MKKTSLERSCPVRKRGSHVLEPGWESPYDIGMSHIERSSKPDIPMNPDESIFTVAQGIAHAFLAAARQNELGIVEDRDTKYLHDFRVSIRRVRSMLSLFKGVYDEKENRNLSYGLAAIMQHTNQLRDLDVYLESRSQYLEYAPQNQHHGLGLLFDMFEKERQVAFEQVCAYLVDPEYQEQIKRLQAAFANANGVAKGHAANEPALRFACRATLKHYRKVVRIANGITPNTPDSTVHELRIQCKKLRYLMEFFTPLFPLDNIKPLIKSLKGLQDTLGQFNDYSVQREALASFAAKHPLLGREGIKLTESVGALVATLCQLQLKVRGEIDHQLSVFCNKETSTRFKMCFSRE